MTDTSRIQSRLDAGTAAWLDSRGARMRLGSHHQQASAELALWQAALAAELRRIRLTAAEARCLADVMGGVTLTPAIGRPGVCYAEASDAFRIAAERDPASISSYGAKHGIDEARLLDYLGRLGPAADHALADAISRWWDAGEDGTAGGFAAAGIITAEAA